MNKIINLYLKLFHFWMSFPEKFRYLLVGGYNTVVSYAIYALILWKWGHPQWALFWSFLISSANSYWTQKIYVFNTRGNVVREYFRCLFSWGVSYLLNRYLLMWLLYMEWNPYFAQFLALALVTVNSYLMLKYLAFQNGKGVQQ